MKWSGALPRASWKSLEHRETTMSNMIDLRPIARLQATFCSVAGVRSYTAERKYANKSHACTSSHTGPIDLPACVLIGEPCLSYIPVHQDQNTNVYALDYSSYLPCQAMTTTNERDGTVQLKLDRGLGVLALHRHKTTQIYQCPRCASYLYT